MRRDGTVYDFLDARVREIKSEFERTGERPRRKQLQSELLVALHNPLLRSLIVNFLQTPEPEKHYQPVLQAMKSAWRTVSGEAIPSKEPLVLGGAADQTGEEAMGMDMDPLAPGLYAKTYVIAAEIHFELQGKGAEFRKLVQNVAELKLFIQQQFGVARLAGTFKKLKGFSFWDVLKTGNDSKIGQLKPNFRQIIDNPGIFGEKIVEKAKQIADDHFV